jgi:hypothetical protein
MTLFQNTAYAMVGMTGVTCILYARNVLTANQTLMFLCAFAISTVIVYVTEKVPADKTEPIMEETKMTSVQGLTDKEWLVFKRLVLKANQEQWIMMQQEIARARGDEQ